MHRLRVLCLLVGAAFFGAAVGPSVGSVKLTESAAAAAEPLDVLADWTIDASVTYEQKATFWDGLSELKQEARYTDESAGSTVMSWHLTHDGREVHGCSSNTTSGIGTGTATLADSGEQAADWGLSPTSTYTSLRPVPAGDIALLTTVTPCPPAEKYTILGGRTGPPSAPIFLPGTLAELAAEPVGASYSLSYSQHLPASLPGQFEQTWTVSYSAEKRAPADSDDDGVPDVDDNCPLVPGLPELNGCPAPDEGACTEGYVVADASVTTSGWLVPDQKQFWVDVAIKDCRTDTSVSVQEGDSAINAQVYVAGDTWMQQLFAQLEITFEQRGELETEWQKLPGIGGTEYAHAEVSGVNVETCLNWGELLLNLIPGIRSATFAKQWNKMDPKAQQQLFDRLDEQVLKYVRTWLKAVRLGDYEAEVLRVVMASLDAIDGYSISKLLAGLTEHTTACVGSWAGSFVVHIYPTGVVIERWEDNSVQPWPTETSSQRIA